ARMDQPPEYVPAFHVPEIAAFNANSNIEARLASGGSETELVQAPAYSLGLRSTLARQAPLQPCADLLADQPPCIRTLPVESRRLQAPVTPPFCCALAVQVPAKFLPPLDALQVPCKSAPDRTMTELSKVPRVIALILAARTLPIFESSDAAMLCA